MSLDTYLRYRELGSVLDGVEQSEAAMEKSNADLAKVFKTANRGDGWNAKDRAAIETSAENGASELVKSITHLEDKRSSSPGIARMSRLATDTLRMPAVWLDLYESYAKLDTTNAKADIRIAATWDLAHEAFRDAVPPLIGHKLSRRIERIWTDTEPKSASGHLNVREVAKLMAIDKWLLDNPLSLVAATGAVVLFLAVWSENRRHRKARDRQDP